jgi:hypothetical protein
MELEKDVPTGIKENPVMAVAAIGETAMSWERAELVSGFVN